MSVDEDCEPLQKKLHLPSDEQDDADSHQFSVVTLPSEAHTDMTWSSGSLSLYFHLKKISFWVFCLLFGISFKFQFQLVRCIYRYINVHNSCPKNYIRTLIFSSQCQIMMKASKWRWRQQQTVVCLMKVWLRYRSGFIIFPRFFVVLFFYFSRSSELFLNLSSVFFFCTDSPGGWRIIVDQSEDRSVSSQSGLVHD